MNIREKFDKYLEENKQNIELQEFNKVVDKVIKEAESHLRLISAQMCHYDMHDNTHSEKVLENIENLLGKDGIEKLSIMEAYLIYLSAYVHDVGMAMPDWAFKMVTNVESEEYVYHSSDTYYSEIKKEILTQKTSLYGSFERIKDLVFCPETEDALIDNLVAEIYRYEKFRCGYQNELNDKLKLSLKDYKDYSEVLRMEYFRQYHGERSALFIRNLWRAFSPAIKEASARNVAESLAVICASHCEDFKKVEQLKRKQEVLRREYYNEQYVAILLRLGDAIHFSNERAPRELYLERTIMNPVSDSHWTVKFQDLEYFFEKRESEQHVIYKAYCKEPKLYYFLNSYLDGVDNELLNYYLFIRDLERSDSYEYNRCKLPIAMKVDREISHSPEYNPDTSLKFTLNQSKIISLLMGVQLYKDEFLCLRELYQNALDACKCMNAYYKKKEMNYNSFIEFGVEEDSQGKYLYCLDNGIGMTKHTITKYLLNVGNSYYDSREFLIDNSSWNNNVKPVSKFGVGLLSCYMLGDFIEVITRNYQNKHEINCVCMHGMEEFGYYRDVSFEEKERVREHGTLIKVYLKDKFVNKINTYVPEEIDRMLFLKSILLENDLEIRGNKFRDEQIEEINRFSESIYYQLNKFLLIPSSEVKIRIKDEMKKEYEIVSVEKEYKLINDLEFYENTGFSFGWIFRNSKGWFKEYEYRKKYKVEDSALLLNTLHEFYSSYQFIVCSGGNEEVQISTILHLPNKRGMENEYFLEVFDIYSRGIFGGYCVDGLVVGEMEVWKFDSLEDEIFESGMLMNYVGKNRPELSVDRTSVISVSDELIKIKEEALDTFIRLIVEKIEKYIEEMSLENDICTLKFLNMYLKEKYSSEVYFKIMKLLSYTIYKEYCIDNISFGDLFKKKQFQCKVQALNESKINSAWLINVCGQAKKICVIDDILMITMQEKQELEVCTLSWRMENLVICVDEWEGKYREYDATKALWPLIPRKIFDILNEEHCDNNRIKYDNGGRTGIKLRDVIESDFISFLDVSFLHFASLSDVLMCLGEDGNDKVYPKCVLDGIKDDEKRKNVIYIYIDPKELNEEEKEKIKNYESNEDYMKGIREGWSILFYRYNDEYLIVPGMMSRDEIIKQIPEYARNHDDGVEYYFTDGTKAF